MNEQTNERMDEYVLALAQNVQSPSCFFSKTRLWHLDNEQEDRAQGGFGRCLPCKCQGMQE